MHKVQTDKGEKFLVQLVGARSYRAGGMHVTRGGTLAASKRTRDYLVRDTGGQFIDYDPTPDKPIEEIRLAQLGDDMRVPVDLDDFDNASNPPLTQAQARELSARSGRTVDQNGQPVEAGDGDDEIDTEQVARARAARAIGDHASNRPADDGRGDLTAADLPTRNGKGGATAKKASEGEVISGKVKVVGTPKPDGAKAEGQKTGAVTVD